MRRSSSPRAPANLSPRRYRVERYAPGISPAGLQAEVKAIAAAAEYAVVEGEMVKYLGSTFCPEEESCFSTFEAGSRRAVEHVCRRAGIAQARIVEVRECPADEPIAVRANDDGLDEGREP